MENNLNSLLGPQICNLFLIYFLGHGDTLNTERYCGTLENSQQAIRLKSLELLHQNVFILHHNARLRITTSNCEWLRRFR